MPGEADELFQRVKTCSCQLPLCSRKVLSILKLPNTGSNHSVEFSILYTQKKWALSIFLYLGDKTLIILLTLPVGREPGK